MGCPKTTKFEIIKELENQIPIIHLCKVAQVSRSGYYKWVKSNKSNDEDRLKEIITFEFNRLMGIYGYRRMKILLRRKYQITANHKRIYRIMKSNNLQAVIRRRKSYINYSSREQKATFPNILNQSFVAEKPNLKWVTDITQINFQGSWIYLSVILDLFNNEVIAYKVSNSIDLRLVIDMIEVATKERNVQGILLHSDQGGHYKSKHYNSLLKSLGIVQSMSRKGNCLDNATIESFFGHLKCEILYKRKYETKGQLFKAIDDYIYFYNNERFQTKLNEMTPVEYRNQFLYGA